MSLSTPRSPDRYGTLSRASRRMVVVLAIVLGAAGTAWLGWVVWFHGRPEVTSQLVGFDVRGQHAATATFTVVRREEAVRASCLLRALAADHAVVGELEVPVTAGPTVTRVDATVRTERRATAVELVGCRAGDQARRR